MTYYSAQQCKDHFGISIDILHERYISEQAGTKQPTRGAAYVRIITTNTDLNVDNSLFRQLFQRVGKLYERPNELHQLSLRALDICHLRAAESHAVIILVLGVVKVE